MSKRLEDKVAIVTGAAGYLGTSHCVHLAREGAKVVVTDIVDGQATVDAVKKAGGKAIFVRVDVASQEDTLRMAAETLKAYGRIDILVNNAALLAGSQKPWTEFTPEEWDQNLAVDLKGMFLCARRVPGHVKTAVEQDHQYFLGHDHARVSQPAALRQRQGGYPRH